MDSVAYETFPTEESMDAGVDGLKIDSVDE